MGIQARDISTPLRACFKPKILMEGSPERELFFLIVFLAFP
jgi:hypothetical protein